MIRASAAEARAPRLRRSRSRRWISSASRAARLTCERPPRRPGAADSSSASRASSVPARSGARRGSSSNEDRRRPRAGAPPRHAGQGRLGRLRDRGRRGALARERRPSAHRLEDHRAPDPPAGRATLASLGLPDADRQGDAPPNGAHPRHRADGHRQDGDARAIVEHHQQTTRPTTSSPSRTRSSTSTRASAR